MLLPFSGIFKNSFKLNACVHNLRLIHCIDRWQNTFTPLLAYVAYFHRLNMLNQHSLGLEMSEK